MVAQSGCNVNNGNIRQPTRAAVILAGGNGTRFRELSRKIAGHDLPKQFCRVIGEATLLDQTRKRVALSVPAELTLAVVTRAHERFFVSLLADMPAQNVVVQPDNRGTAPAILYSLLREIGLVKVKGKDVLVPVVEIVALEDDGVDPAYYQRFAGAIAMLREGDSPEAELRGLLRDRPNDQVIAMCLERLRTSNGRPPTEIIFEFDTK